MFASGVPVTELLLNELLCPSKNEAFEPDPPSPDLFCLPLLFLITLEIWNV